MQVQFEKEYLAELYATGKCNNKKYRFQPSVIKNYIRRIDTLIDAPNIEALYLINSLNYEVLKGDKTKLSASEKKQILDNVSWYDEEADKVVKKTEKLSGQKLTDLLDYLGCTEKDLAYYGYFATDKKGEYTLYETESDLRDSESIPLKENIQDYFLREVQPYAEESWIALDSVKIGYELSFNKYFYQPAPVRSLEEVTKDILALEQEGDGLLAEILNF